MNIIIREQPLVGRPCGLLSRQSRRLLSPCLIAELIPSPKEEQSDHYNATNCIGYVMLFDHGTGLNADYIINTDHKDNDDFPHHIRNLEGQLWAPVSWFTESAEGQGDGEDDSTSNQSENTRQAPEKPMLVFGKVSVRVPGTYHINVVVIDKIRYLNV